MLVQQAIVGDLGITEVAKGSTFHNLYLWMAGAHIGRDVYFDNGGCMVSCCISPPGVHVLGPGSPQHFCGSQISSVAPPLLFWRLRLTTLLALCLEVSGCLADLSPAFLDSQLPLFSLRSWYPM